MHPGRIDKNHLMIGARVNAQNSVSCRLWLRRHNTHFGADDRVDERRFANVRPANDGNKPAPKFVTQRRLLQKPCLTFLVQPLVQRHADWSRNPRFPFAASECDN